MKNEFGRDSKGATLGFVVAAIGVLVAIVFVIWMVLSTIGGQRELSNAVDAGTLNAANQAPKVRVTPSPAAAAVFADCLAADGTVGLDNINKVQAKALLLMLNSRSLNMIGKGTPQSDINFQHAFNASREIENKLSDQLNNAANLHGYFTEVADANDVRMVNCVNNVKPVAGWQTACLNRGQESNVYLQQDQLPPKIKLTDLPTKKLADGRDYLCGYTPINFGAGKAINFVSFESGQQSHLVSLKTAQAGNAVSAPIAGIPKPVPNTFKCGGEMTDTRSRERLCWSAAICNQRAVTAPAAMEGAFVHITLKQDGLRFFPWQNPLLGLLPPAKTKKSATSVMKVYPGLIGGLGLLVFQATNGAQYDKKTAFPTANNLLHALYWQGNASQYERVDEQLLSRVNQIKPGVSAKQLQDLLMTVPVPKTNSAEYWIARDQGGELKVFTPATMTGMNKIALANAKSDIKPDGKPGTIIGHVPMVKGNSSKALEITFTPFIKIKMVPSGTLTRHEVVYQPGSGVNGSLLDIEQRDQTFVFTGKVSSPTPPPVEGTPVPPCGCVH